MLRLRGTFPVWKAPQDGSAQDQTRRSVAGGRAGVADAQEGHGPADEGQGAAREGRGSGDAALRERVARRLVAGAAPGASRGGGGCVCEQGQGTGTGSASLAAQADAHAPRQPGAVSSPVLAAVLSPARPTKSSALRWGGMRLRAARF